MNEVLWVFVVGISAGIIDIMPMMLKKLSKFSILSAFIQWVVISIVIANTSVFGLTGWLNGFVIAVLMAIPIVVLVFENDKKSVPIILGTSAVLGSVIGVILS